MYIYVFMRCIFIHYHAYHALKSFTLTVYFTVHGRETNSYKLPFKPLFSNFDARHLNKISLKTQHWYSLLVEKPMLRQIGGDRDWTEFSVETFAYLWDKVHTDIQLYVLQVNMHAYMRTKQCSKAISFVSLLYTLLQLKLFNLASDPSVILKKLRKSDSLMFIEFHKRSLYKILFTVNIF